MEVCRPSEGAGPDAGGGGDSAQVLTPGVIAAVTNLRTAADPGERAAWVALASTPGIGWPRLGALLAATGSARGALEAPFAFLCSIPGISRA